MERKFLGLYRELSVVYLQACNVLRLSSHCMHTRYPLRRTLYREAPGGDKARMTRATAQKVRKAREMEEGEE